jgi:hypothetical protein
MAMTLDSNDHALREATFRKGEFRETARDIVWKDREGRKYRRSVDTGGAILRAMESAYRLGVAHGSSQDTNKSASKARAATAATVDTIAWNSIPPRPRGIFKRIFAFKWIVILAPKADVWRTPSDRWACYWDWGDAKPEEKRYELAKTFSRSTLAPIVRLGLMEERAVAGRTYLAVTQLAYRTWDDALAAGHVKEVR